jgi:catechol 2,3-dioxygenase-like lactoylglutathione lyase family enzyme
VTDPQAAIDFYTSRFAAEKAKFAGLADGVWAQKSWLLFTKVNAPPPSEIVSTIWHIGWGAEDMPKEIERQKAMGTRFQTEMTDISDIGGNTAMKGKGLFYYAYVDGPEHVLIELNTARHHNFGHVHMFSEDPVAAGEWYVKHFGAQNARFQRERRAYNGVAIGPSASLMMDNVNIIIYPVEYPKSQMAKEWEGRKTFEPTKGRAVDHLGFSVDNLEQAIERLRKDTVKVTDEPRAIAQGKIKFAFVEGPDKIRIEVIEGHPKKD